MQFRLTWDGGAYKVSAPGIESCDVVTADELVAAATENAELRKQAGEMRADCERAWAARDVAYDAVKKLREACAVFAMQHIHGYVFDRLTRSTRERAPQDIRDAWDGAFEVVDQAFQQEINGPDLAVCSLLLDTAIPDPTDEAILAARDARVREPLEKRIAELETWYQRALGDAYYYDRARRELMHLKSTKGQAEIRAAVKREVLKLHSYSEWHEDQGAVLWLRFPLCEPGYFGDPLTDNWPYEEEDESSLWYVRIDGNEMQEQWEQLAALDAETTTKEGADA